MPRLMRHLPRIVVLLLLYHNYPVISSAFSGILLNIFDFLIKLLHILIICDIIMLSYDQTIFK